AIAMSHRAFEVFAHQRALGEDAGEDERQYDRKPATGRKAGVEMKRMFRGGDGLADRSDDQAEKLQSQQRPGYRMETVGIGGDKWVALSHGLHDPQQPPEDGIVEGDRGEPEGRNGAKPHDHQWNSGGLGDAEGGEGPVLGDDSRGQQNED